MANSIRLGPMQGPIGACAFPARSAGPLGFLDQADPNVVAFLGDTPGPLGMNDWGDPTIGASFRTAYAGGYGYGFASALTPDTVLSWGAIKSDFERWESLITHMYLDTTGHVTVGIGDMLPDIVAAQALSFFRRKDGKPASAEEIKTEFNSIDKLEFGQPYGAKWYRSKTTLDLQESDCWEIFRKRIDNEFIPSLNGYFMDWKSFPVPVKQALLDMAYNLGMGSATKKTGLRAFRGLKSAVDSADWANAAGACERKGIPKERNDWTRGLFLLAAKGKK